MSKNKPKYIIVNYDAPIGIVYEHPQYGRTIVIQEKVDLNHPIQIWDAENNKFLENSLFLTFIQEMLPEKNEQE